MILYYSGTGNSRYAASILSQEAGGELICMNDLMRSRIIEPENARFDFASAEPFVIVCPTYCWRVPRVVEKFLRESRFSGSKEIYFFLTCGGSTAAAAKYTEKLAVELGLTFRGLDSVVMPENYIAMFDSPSFDDAQATIRAAVSKIESVGRMIKFGRSIEDSNGGTGLKAFPSLLNSQFYKHSVSDKKFRVKDNCIGCRQCAAVCPMVNITIEDSKPVWHGNCTHCMGCISICPEEAIEYGRTSVGKRRYYLSATGYQKPEKK